MGAGQSDREQRWCTVTSFWIVAYRIVLEAAKRWPNGTTKRTAYRKVVGCDQCLNFNLFAHRHKQDLIKRLVHTGEKRFSDQIIKLFLNETPVTNCYVDRLFPTATVQANLTKPSIRSRDERPEVQLHTALTADRPTESILIRTEQLRNDSFRSITCRVETLQTRSNNDRQRNTKAPNLFALAAAISLKSNDETSYKGNTKGRDPVTWPMALLQQAVVFATTAIVCLAVTGSVVRRVLNLIDLSYSGCSCLNTGAQITDEKH
ncbi:hypothetical protein CLF_109017 [Clonorchis sinensis]|uniref:Uncharacterized protein n=1 Tax=Clonorchis sinensis TaxID=79923 RepID=G7YS64_CLOSI|nr:hypothetical protein CLF_109017 [Clonorchis sinensis]